VSYIVDRVLENVDQIAAGHLGAVRAGEQKSGRAWTMYLLDMWYVSMALSCRVHGFRETRINMNCGDSTICSSLMR
jgi:hypothetical protein